MRRPSNSTRQQGLQPDGMDGWASPLVLQHMDIKGPRPGWRPESPIQWIYAATDDLPSPYGTIVVVDRGGGANSGVQSGVIGREKAAMMRRWQRKQAVGDVEDSRPQAMTPGEPWPSDGLT